MSAITPNSTIEFYKCIRLDKNYNNTFHFASRTEQETFFTYYGNLTGTRIVKNNLQYVRKDSNTIKVEMTEAEAYKINYMRFKNTNYENKYFYAFVTNAEYVNDATTLITFQIDVMQTWLPNIDYKFGECFIDREHSETDAIGDNLLEDVFYGDYILNQYGNTYTGISSTELDKKATLTRYVYTDSLGQVIGSVSGDFKYMLIFALSKDFISFTPVSPSDPIPPALSLVNNIPGGFALYGIPFNKDENEDTFHIDITKMATAIIHGISSGSDNADDILFSFIAPMGGVTRGNPITYNTPYFAGSYRIYCSCYPITGFKYHSLQFDASLKKPTRLDGYLPKNNKLYTFPYSYQLLTDLSGNTSTFKYEDFYNHEAKYTINGIFNGSNITYSATPYFYEEIPSNHNKKLILEEAPSSSITENHYAEWVQRYGMANNVKVLNSAISGITNMTAGIIAASTAGTSATAASLRRGGVFTAIGGGESVLETALSAYAEREAQKNIGNSSNGTTGGCSSYQIASYNFIAYDMCIKAQFAERIDNFFSLYGYKTNKLKQPAFVSAHKRTNWNYIKATLVNITYDSVTTQGIPQNALDTITEIYNRGITFWEYSPTTSVTGRINTVLGDYLHYSMNNPIS